MRLELEDWKNGWCEVEIGLRPAEIGRLIDLLHLIRDDPDQHVHLSSDFGGSGGVGAVTFYQMSAADEDNGKLTSRAYLPGEEVPDPAP